MPPSGLATAMAVTGGCLHLAKPAKCLRQPRRCSPRPTLTEALLGRGRW